MITIKQEINNVRTLKVQLLDEMKYGRYAKDVRLPRETVLSEELGISRTQLRDILAGLEQEGFITRRLGVGTIINRHVLNVKSRMDMEVEVLDIIRNNGYEPGVIFLSALEEKADEFLAEKLKISVGDIIVRVSKLCTADGCPALYFQDIFARKIVKERYDLKELANPIFQFLEKKCNAKVYMDLTRLHAVTADPEIAKILEVPVGTLLLNMEEVDYDMDGNVVFYSKQYFIEGVFEQTVLRKRLY